MIGRLVDWLVGWLVAFKFKSILLMLSFWHIIIGFHRCPLWEKSHWQELTIINIAWPHKALYSPCSHSMSATILSTCYASTESLGVSDLNNTNIISFNVPGRTSRVVDSTNFTTIVFTLPHIMAPKLLNQLPIRNVVSMHGNTGERPLISNTFRSDPRCARQKT